MPVNPSGKTWDLINEGNATGSTDNPVGGGGGGGGGDPTALPLINGWDSNVFTVGGAFTVNNSGTFNYERRLVHPICKHSDPTKMWIATPEEDHLGTHDYHVAEITIPDLLTDPNPANLNVAPHIAHRERIVANSQTGVRNFGGENGQARGIYEYNGALITIRHTNFRGSATPHECFYVVDDVSNLSTSNISGQIGCQYDDISAGWITEIPTIWQTSLGFNHIICSFPISSVRGRYSFGPSAFGINLDDILNANTDDTVSVTPFVYYFESGFAEIHGLHKKMYPGTDVTVENYNPDTGGTEADGPGVGNDIWTMVTRCNTGFIIPGTRTYVCIGMSGGMGNAPITGVDSWCVYKDPGVLALDGSVEREEPAGDAPRYAYDRYPFYYMYDLNDFVDAKNGVIQPHDVLPYSWGRIPLDYTPYMFKYGEDVNSLWEPRNYFSGYLDEDNNRFFLCKSKSNPVTQYRDSPVIWTINYSV